MSDDPFYREANVPLRVHDMYPKSPLSKLKLNPPPLLPRSSPFPPVSDVLGSRPARFVTLVALFFCLCWTLSRMPFFTEQFRNGLYDELYPPSNLPIPRKIWQVRFAAGTLEVPLMSIEEGLRLEAQKKKIAEESMGLGIESGKKAAVESVKNAEVEAHKETVKQAANNAKEAILEAEKYSEAPAVSAKLDAKQSATVPEKQKALDKDAGKAPVTGHSQGSHEKELKVVEKPLIDTPNKKMPSDGKLETGNNLHEETKGGGINRQDILTSQGNESSQIIEAPKAVAPLAQSGTLGDSWALTEGDLSHKKQKPASGEVKDPKGKDTSKDLGTQDKVKGMPVSGKQESKAPDQSIKANAKESLEDQAANGKIPVSDKSQRTKAEKVAAPKKVISEGGLQVLDKSSTIKEETVRKQPKPIELDEQGTASQKKSLESKDAIKDSAQAAGPKDTVKGSAKGVHKDPKDDPSKSLTKAEIKPATPPNEGAVPAHAKSKRSTPQADAPPPAAGASPPPPASSAIHAHSPVPLPSLIASHSLHSLTAHNPDFSHTLLTTAGASSFASYHLARTSPSLLPTYLSLRNPALKAEITRYIVLAAAGGYWADLDTISLHGFEDLIPVEWRKRVRAIVGVEYDQGEDLTLWPGMQRRVQFARWTVAAAPGHVLPSRMAARALQGVGRLAKERGKGVWECEFSEEEVEALVGAGRWADEVLRVLGEGIGGEVQSLEVSGLKEPRVWGDVLVLPWETLGGWQAWGKGRGAGDRNRGVVRRFWEGGKF